MYSYVPNSKLGTICTNSFSNYNGKLFGIFILVYNSSRFESKVILLGMQATEIGKFLLIFSLTLVMFHFEMRPI